MLNCPVGGRCGSAYRFGRGEIIRLRDLNLFRVVTAGSLFTWDGIKAWCRAPWPLMIAALPLGLLSATALRSVKVLELALASDSCALHTTLERQ